MTIATSHSPGPIVAAGVVELAGLFQSGAATPVDALQLYLSRIQRLNPALNAFLVVDHEQALRAAHESAARWSVGTPLSRIDGAPVGVKANIAVEGLPWHAGVGAYRDRLADRDADVVADLRGGGAVIVGLLNMHEAALGATSDNRVFGRCHNPYRADVTPGGSSGGSASAVAAGLCAAALGTDTLGSVRIPSAYCGVFGHKPTFGRISAGGVVPLAPSLDTVGVHARSASDVMALLSVLTTSPPLSAEPDLGALTCGVLDLAGQIDLHPDAAEAFARTVRAARAAGMRLHRIDPPGYDLAAVRRDALVIVEIEALEEYRAALDQTPQGFSPALKAMLQWAARQPASVRESARDRLALAAERLDTHLAPFDAILTPATPGPAFGFEEPPPANLADFAMLANIANLASTAFPVGLGRGGLPLANQILSRADALTVRLADTLCRATPPPEV